MEKLKTQVLGRRTVAVIVDGLIIGLLVIPIGIATDQFDGSADGWYYGVSFGASFLYFFLLEALSGRTIGKMVTGIRVAESDGGRAGFVRIFIRNLIRPVDSFGAYFVGWLVAMLSGKDRRGRIGDLAAGTYVIRK